MKHQGKANALSWRSYLAPRLGEPTFDNQKQVILGPARLQATHVFGMPMDSHVLDTIREDLKIDAFAQAILAQIDPSRASSSQLQQVRTLGNSNTIMDYYSSKKNCMFRMVLVAFK
jgi:hypothetical protein